MEENKNYGVLFEGERELDFKLGGETAVVVPQRGVKDWTPYLPDFESQRDALNDMSDCVSMSGMHHGIEMQINCDIANGRYPQASLDYFHSAGYMVNGKFKASVRYNAVMNGTTPTGQYMNIAGDHYATGGDGLLPEAEFPFLPTMNWVEYYSMPSGEQILKARKIYDYIHISYQWLTKFQVASQLENTPIQIATAVCAGWNSAPVIPACNQPMQHCTTLFAQDSKAFTILDHYEPYIKKLAPDYPLQALMQYVAQPVQPLAVVDKPVYNFTMDLEEGSSGAEVTALQKALAWDGELNPKYVCGIFGPRTKLAVTAFQEKYASQILTPLGLKHGTGFVRQSTRNELNKLLSQV